MGQKAKKSKKSKGAAVAVEKPSGVTSKTAPASELAGFFEKSKSLFGQVAKPKAKTSATPPASKPEATESDDLSSTKTDKKKKRKRDEAEPAATVKETGSSENGTATNTKIKAKKSKLEAQTGTAEASDSESSSEEENQEESVDDLLAEDVLSEEGVEEEEEKTAAKNKGIDTEKRNPKEDPRTVFVGNVPMETRQKQLKKFFQRFGDVTSVRFRSVAVLGTAVDRIGDQKLVKKVSVNQGLYNPNRNSKNAYVVFTSEDSVDKALAANNEVRGSLPSLARSLLLIHCVLLVGGTHNSVLFLRVCRSLKDTSSELIG